MPTELIATYLNLPQFALIVSRIAGVVVAMPLIGGLAVPANVRVLLILALAWLVAPLVPALEASPASMGALLSGMLGEALLGALIGVILAIAFVGLQLGATLIAQESGLAFGQILDPTTSEEETVLGTFYLQLATVVLRAAGYRTAASRSGHHDRTLEALGLLLGWLVRALITRAARAVGFDRAMERRGLAPAPSARTSAVRWPIT